MGSEYLGNNDSTRTITVKFEHCSAIRILIHDISCICMEDLANFFRKSLNLYSDFVDLMFT